MGEMAFSPFPGHLADAVAVCHSVTQINVTHMGFTIFNDHRLHSFPNFLEVTFQRGNGHIILTTWS
jgi:hypothetical protein